MPNLGKKFSCYSCHTKFYDLGKPEPICPKCGADQRDAEETPLVTSSRGRRVIEDPVDDEFEDEEGATPRPAATEDEEFEEPEAADDDDDDEEEY